MDLYLVQNIVPFVLHIRSLKSEIYRTDLLEKRNTIDDAMEVELNMKLQVQKNEEEEEEEQMKQVRVKRSRSMQKNMCSRVAAKELAFARKEMEEMMKTCSCIRMLEDLDQVCDRGSVVGTGFWMVWSLNMKNMKIYRDL